MLPCTTLAVYLLWLLPGGYWICFNLSLWSIYTLRVLHRAVNVWLWIPNQHLCNDEQSRSGRGDHLASIAIGRLYWWQCNRSILSKYTLVTSFSERWGSVRVSFSLSQLMLWSRVYQSSQCNHTQTDHKRYSHKSLFLCILLKEPVPVCLLEMNMENNFTIQPSGFCTAHF